MNTYRRAFRVTAGVNIVLLTVIAGLWLHFHAPATSPRAQSPSNDAALPASDPAAASTAQQTEPTLAPVQLSPQRLQSIGVRTGEVESKRIEDRILTTGNVAVDETRLAYVQARFSGYIQKVFVNATYQHVRKGEALFTIYSPDLVSTERELLVARQNQRQLSHSADPEVAKDAASLVDAAVDRLGQWNIPQREITRLASGGPVRQNLEIDSPVSGYVTEREALPNKYVQPDTRLYTVADLSMIWVFAQVFQNDLGRVKVGDAAVLSVDAYPGQEFTGRVDFIYPEIDMTTRTARVRLKFPNPDLKLMPGMFVNVSLQISMGEHVVVPATGVLQTGTRQVVFVDRGQGNLEPRMVQLGERVGDDFVVLKGLKAGEKIITSANFLIDSESQLQAALGSFAPPPPGASAGAAAAGPKATADLSTEPTPPRKGSNIARVRLRDERGSPLAGAHVTATFFMAAMPAMGMAAMRVPVTLADKGNGLYEGALQLGSGGTWQVAIVAEKDGQVIASQQLSVSATGGM